MYNEFPFNVDCTLALGMNFMTINCFAEPLSEINKL